MLSFLLGEVGDKNIGIHISLHIDDTDTDVMNLCLIKLLKLGGGPHL